MKKVETQLKKINTLYFCENTAKKKRPLKNPKLKTVNYTEAVVKENIQMVCLVLLLANYFKCELKLSKEVGQ